jgi:hypothetical protein
LGLVWSGLLAVCWWLTGAETWFFAWSRVQWHGFLLFQGFDSLFNQRFIVLRCGSYSLLNLLMRVQNLSGLGYRVFRAKASRENGAGTGLVAGFRVYKSPWDSPPTHTPRINEVERVRSGAKGFPANPLRGTDKPQQYPTKLNGIDKGA